ncbi:hypothetical protein [Chondromyces apiculatus]|uniref:Uncharacterized protein n=1 Tax=Chondromyces apiculatus DSM 436 TaxID=1192034 RepID=A0A017TGA3_9BACT|nr:hypothetical protein [Chondromyces apiculatus]EYF08328.1 Hypothetical protein CAP_6089 [Chondromyces apiculatus DSM 436]
MRDDDDDDDDDDRIPVGAVDPTREISAIFDDLETLLKNGDVVAALTKRDVNASLALVAIDGLRAYLENRKADAVEDLSTVAEEIKMRMQLSSTSRHGNGHDPSN